MFFFCRLKGKITVATIGSRGNPEAQVRQRIPIPAQMGLYALRPKVTYAGKAVNLHKQKFEETITAVRSVTYVPD